MLIALIFFIGKPVLLSLSVHVCISVCVCVRAQNLCVISNVHRLSQQLKMVLDCCNVHVKLIWETCAGLYEYK